MTKNLERKKRRLAPNVLLRLIFTFWPKSVKKSRQKTLTSKLRKFRKLRVRGGKNVMPNEKLNTTLWPKLIKSVTREKKENGSPQAVPRPPQALSLKRPRPKNQSLINRQNLNHQSELRLKKLRNLQNLSLMTHHLLTKTRSYSH